MVQPVGRQPFAVFNCCDEACSDAAVVVKPFAMQHEMVQPVVVPPAVMQPM